MSISKLVENVGTELVPPSGILIAILVPTCDHSPSDEVHELLLESDWKPFCLVKIFITWSPGLEPTDPYANSRIFNLLLE